MAQSFGSWANHIRIWFDYGVDGISQTSTTTTLWCEGYVQLDGSSGMWGEWPADRNGAWGAAQWTANIGNLGPNGSAWLAGAGRPTVTLTDDWQNFSYALGLTGHWGHHWHGITVSVPPRYARTPTNLTVSRISDTSQKISWRANSRYANAVIQRWTKATGWREIARIGGASEGSTQTYTDTTTQPNGYYAYRVAGIGGSGQSPWSAEGSVYTTPAPPTGVTAVKKSQTAIEVTATGLPPYATSYEVWDNGARLATGVTAFPWVHSNPSASTTHTYTVRSARGSLVSGDSAPSNTVQLLTAPNAPTNLTPNGVTVAAGAQVFTWQHNPVDTTAQTAYGLRYRRQGSTAWTTVTGTTAQTRSVSLSPTVWEWQVRTKGQHPDYSPWSGVATVDVISKPAVAITVPGGEPWREGFARVEWNYSQAQERPQSRWQARLFQPGNPDFEEVAQGVGDTSTHAFSRRLMPDETYAVSVQVWAGELAEPAETISTFTTLFEPPPAPVIETIWDDDNGKHILTVQAGSGEGTAPATNTLDIERSVDGGQTWQPLTMGLDPSTQPEFVLSDGEALSAGITKYRVTATAPTLSSSVTVVDAVADSRAVWLSTGSGYGLTAPIRYNLDVQQKAGRARQVQRYEGRARAVAYAGAAISRTIQVAGKVLPHVDGNTDSGRLIQVAQDPSPLHLYRDPAGRRVYGMLSDVDIKRSPAAGGEILDVSFTVEEAE